jgi:ParB family chromosome partitioning protein
LLEAEQLQRRLARPGQTVRSVGAAIGKSHAYVQQRIDLLRMIPEFQELLRRGEINIKTGRQLGIQPPEIQQQILAAGPPYSPASRRPAEAPAGNPVSTERPSSAPVPPEPAAAAGNPVTAEPLPSTGPGTAAPVPGHAAPVNPVSTEAASASPPPSPPATAMPSPAGGADSGGNLVSTPDSPGALVENARTAAAQWLDNALTELDRALPAGGDSTVDQAFADARRCIQEARHALDKVTLERVSA